MPAGNRRLLGVFLLVLALALVYGLVALWSVEFIDAPAVELAPASKLDRGRDDTAQPWIEQLDPYAVTAGSAQPMLTLYGYNFTPQAKVVFHASDERVPRFVDANILLAPLLSTDLARPGFISVMVVQHGRYSNPKWLTVKAATKPLGILNLRFAAFYIGEEARLVLLVLCAGALGAYIHAIKSLVDYIGNRTLTASWFWFYLTRPFVGMALALIFYAVIRGGFLAGTPADTKAVNPFGVVAISGLIGMFADKAGQKLSEVFDVMFRADDTRKDKLVPLEITTTTLGDATVGQPYNQPIAVKGGQAPYVWSAKGLPTAIQINADTGVLSGTPAASGDATVTILV